MSITNTPKTITIGMAPPKFVVTVPVDVPAEIEFLARQRARNNPYDIEDYLPEYVDVEFDWRLSE